MRRDDDAPGPRIPISGEAGAAIFTALHSLAMHCGESVVTIKKQRRPGGGYQYLVADRNSPVRPAKT
jgi:hypothetical protein